MNKKNAAVLIVSIAALLFLLSGGNAYADIAVNVAVDTSALPVIPGMPSEAFFVLTDGSGTGDGNNTAMMSTFGFGGGSAGTVDTGTATGNYTGDMTGMVSMTDSSFTNIFAETFTAGSSLSFLLNLTTNLDAGSTPDQFSFAIADPFGNPLPNTDLSGDLLVINIDSSNPSISTFGPVTVTSGLVATPEPHLLPFLGVALIALVLLARRIARPPALEPFLNPSLEPFSVGPK